MDQGRKTNKQTLPPSKSNIQIKLDFVLSTDKAPDMVVFIHQL